MAKKIAIIGTVGLPAKYGGFETLTSYLTSYLSKDNDITVYCSGKDYEHRLDHFNGAKLVYLSLNANGIQSIPYDIISVIKALRYADVLLILGVSGCVILPFLKFLHSKKIVVNIDGMEWKREKWSKLAKSFLKMSEKCAVKYADTVITDNKVIQDYVRSEYAINSELIAYGGDHVEKIDLSSEVLNKYPFLEKPYAFSVCRIEPENNLHIIIEAMKQQEKIPLFIIGNWEASQYGIDLRTQYKDYENIHLLDPIYDQDMLNQIRSNCHVYLHGHSAGGTNPSLVEAMSLGLSIFAFGADYNKETTERCAKYFYNVKELIDLVAQTDDESLRSMGIKMGDIADRRYKWEKISKQYSDLLS
ncbi:MAG: DUF1972 domain-containing protein [Bacteroidetes bacterium]|nr:DUF1972 domain-containing protein [Bacteroidota bacterium]